MDNIRSLIAYRLLHGEDRNEADHRELEAWLARDDNNRRLYLRLMDRRHWATWRAGRERIDADTYWDAVARQTVSRKKTVMRCRWWSVAASVVLLLAVGMLSVFRGTEVQPPRELASVILPGSPKAQLVFSDGRKVMLDARLSPDRRIEKDGALIFTDSTGINYMPVLTDTSARTEEPSDVHHTLLVPKGGEYILTLEDGTVVHLNSQSVLEFPVHFAKAKREVYLEGEAYFRVEHAGDLPFIVHTRSMDIHVTGTEFNVRAYQGESKIQTTLARGRVNVTVDGSRYDLLPDQQAELDLKDRSTMVREVEAQDYTAWTEGLFVFKDRRLEEIMNELARWYDFEVFYQNPEVGEMIFGGKLNREGSIEPILKVMEATLALNIGVNGKTIVFQSK